MGVTTSSTVAATYEPIETKTTSSSSIVFNSIPNTYTDLILVAQVKTAGNTNLVLYFNYDQTNKYSRTILTVEPGVSPSSSRNTNQTGIVVTGNAIGNTTYSTHRIEINNYAKSSGVYKTAICRSSNSSSGIDATVGLWRDTSPITSVHLYGVQNFDSTSTFTLYGIKAA